MSSNGPPKDPDDFFADTRMSFGDHIEDLRKHLWRAIAGFGVALFFSLFIGHYVVRFITAPVKDQLEKFYERRANKIRADQAKDPKLMRANEPTPFRKIWVPRKQLKDVLAGKSGDMPERPKIVSQEEAKTGTSEPAAWYIRLWRWLGEGDKPPTDPDDTPNLYKIPKGEEDKHLVGLWVSWDKPLNATGDFQPAQRAFLDIDNPSTLNVQEAFMVWFKVCLVTGVVLGSPWIFWQIWMFVAAGLYPHEKRLVHVYLPVSLFLFLLGVAICQFLVIPRAIEALLWFNEWMGLKADVRLNEWLSFAIYMPLVFGVSFQTPLVMVFLHRLGIMDVDSFRNKRALAWFAMAVFAAVITPSTDALSMLFLWVPMSLLFELGIILIKMSPNQPDLDIEVPQSDELVEV
jgi:sec-independent protein translocase protein TatC